MNRFFVIAGLLTLALLQFSQPATAQGLADTFSGFSSNSSAPIKIEADTLDVDDSSKVAVFTGNVFVTQGDVTLRTEELHVEYSGERDDSQNQQIKRLEARGKLVVQSKGDSLTGDWAIFEMAAELVTVGGNVVVSQGGNVLRGTKLIINLKTGQTHMEASTDPGNSRVQGLFVPKNE